MANLLHLRARLLGLVRGWWPISIALAGLLIVSDAHSSDHEPPPARFKAGDQRQTGWPIEVTWLRRTGPDECELEAGVGFGFPPPVPYSSGETRIRLKKGAMPLEWSLEAWREELPRDEPRGPAIPVPALPTPHNREGRTVAWDLRFLPPFASGYTYLRATAYWADETGCGGQPDLGSQSATWTFAYSHNAKQPPSCHEVEATMVGTPGDDKISGTQWRDVIVARGGDDVIEGGGGNDLICAGPGDDRIDGGQGNDRIYAGKGNDRIRGGPGDDRIHASKGRNTIDCGIGKDVVITNARSRVAEDCERVIRH